MDEKEAFCVFVRLMETYDMRTMFTLNMEGLQLRLYQFSALLSEHLPVLHAHLSFHSIHAAMYASQWFLSLFAYTYPLPLVLRIYDVVFSEGAPETIMRVAVAFLKKNEEKLMQLQEFEDLLEVLTSKLYDVYEDNTGAVIKDAMALSSTISKDKLDALAMAYLAELEDQQKRAGEVTSKRFKDRFGASKNKAEDAKAAAAKAKSATTTTTTTTPPKPKRGSSRLSIAASFGAGLSFGSGGDDTDADNTPSPNTEAQLLDQIQDLAKALSTLQRDHVEVTEAVVTSKMEKMQHIEEIENLRKKVAELERQQNRASMMSANCPSVMSQSDDTASSMTTTSPCSTVHEDSGKLRGPSGRDSSSWSTHSREDDVEGQDVAAKNADLVQRLAVAERELAHVTSELVHAKVNVMEAMNEVEAQRQKAQSIEKILMDSREAVVLLQDQQVVLQNKKMEMAMEMDGLRYERDTFEKDLEVVRQQFEETKRLWLEGQVERQGLLEKVKELELNAAFAASTGSLGRGKSVRKSLTETAMMNMIHSRSGPPSPRVGSFIAENGVAMPLSPGYSDVGSRRGSSESQGHSRRDSSETVSSTVSGRDSTSSSRPPAMVRKGWPSEKAANAGVVPSTPTNNNAGTRKFTVQEGESKLKRSQSTRNSMLFGGLGWRRSTSDS